jgi:hypothetical protein
MTNSIANRTRTYTSGICDLFFSAVGCFVLRRCFSLVTEERVWPEPKVSVRTKEEACYPAAGMGAALILLASAASDEPVAARTHRR